MTMIQAQRKSVAKDQTTRRRHRVFAVERRNRYRCLKDHAHVPKADSGADADETLSKRDGKDRVVIVKRTGTTDAPGSTTCAE